MLAAILAVLLLAAWLFLPSVVVQYHLWAIATEDGDVAEHIESLVRLGRLARPTLFRTLEMQRRQGMQAMLDVDAPVGRQNAACAIVLAKAHENKLLTPSESRDFVRAIFAVRIRGIERHMVPCLLPIAFDSPRYVLDTLGGQPSLELNFDATVIVDRRWEIRSPYGHSIRVHGTTPASVNSNPTLVFRTPMSPGRATYVLAFDPPSPQFYVDITGLELGRHTIQAQFALRNPGLASRDVLETEEFEFWIVEPVEVKAQ
jgi:hypothetical protein